MITRGLIRNNYWNL